MGVRAPFAGAWRRGECDGAANSWRDASSQTGWDIPRACSRRIRAHAREGGGRRRGTAERRCANRAGEGEALADPQRCGAWVAGGERDTYQPGAAGVGHSRSVVPRGHATTADGKGTPSGWASYKDRYGAPCLSWRTEKSTPGANALVGYVTNRRPILLASPAITIDSAGDAQWTIRKITRSFPRSQAAATPNRRES